MRRRRSLNHALKSLAQISSPVRGVSVVCSSSAWWPWLSRGHGGEACEGCSLVTFAGFSPEPQHACSLHARCKFESSWRKPMCALQSPHVDQVVPDLYNPDATALPICHIRLHSRSLARLHIRDSRETLAPTRLRRHGAITIFSTRQLCTSQSKAVDEDQQALVFNFFVKRIVESATRQS